jgi:uncharacterized cofD-like protein
MEKERKVVVVGGGTGIFSVLSGLKKYPLKLTAIVTMADDGGSSGLLREEFGILPPGDIRRALVALSQSTQSLADLFNYRFNRGSLKGHSFGNLFLTALADLEGDFGSAVKEAEKILAVKGEVIPVTLEQTRLQAKLENGQIIIGETNIDIPKHDGCLKIEKVYLHPQVSANPLALKAFQAADLIVIGPGDLYTSIIPNLLVKGIPEAIKESPAQKVYLANMMTKFGETNHFQGKDFIQEVEKYLGEEVLNKVIFNNHWPTAERINQYEEEKAEMVYCRQESLIGKSFQIIEEDLLRPQGFIRHDPEKTAKVLFNLLNSS